jgi:hypothetical protein
LLDGDLQYCPQHFHSDPTTTAFHMAPPLLPTACKLRATKDVCCECSGTSVTF